MAADVGLVTAVVVTMINLSTIDLATIVGGQARAATPAEIEQVNRNSEQWDRDHELARQVHPVMPPTPTPTSR
jgi:hypothetical protein